jgi:hypothetical protein
MATIRKRRPASLFDEIDIQILHELKKKSCSVLELRDKTNVSHHHLKEHLIKLFNHQLIEFQSLKGRKILISLKKIEPGILGNIIMGAIVAGKIIKEDIKENKLKKTERKLHKSIDSLATLS